MPTLFYNLLKTDAVVNIGLARGEGASFFLRSTVIKNNIDSQGARAPLIQILPTNLNV